MAFMVHSARRTASREYVTSSTRSKLIKRRRYTKFTMNYRRLFLLFLLFVPLVANAQYWFQYGARGSGSSSYNAGAKVTIQSIYNQSVGSGSLGFWVGEDLENGAFIQAGYIVTNETGSYPSSCTSTGCSSSQVITKGVPAWFYEYFNPNTNDNEFLGSIGPNASAGANGTFHTYGFYSKGNEWYIFMDNTTIGEINLGSNTSGDNVPVAFAELANASNSQTVIKPVIFYNLSVYKNGGFLPVSNGYSYVGYGVGSKTAIVNPYGVTEVGNRVNYFESGSGLPKLSNGQQLWQLGYYLKIVSNYGNISGTNQYIAYRGIQISAPKDVYINSTSRATFNGWSGSGVSAYSGNSTSTNVTLFSNITEIAKWNVQYLLNVSSEIGSANGYGWYNANSVVNYSIDSDYFYLNSSSRWRFDSWSNGETGTQESIVLDRPYSVSATWNKQYLVNATSILGNVSGTGWYDSNSTASIWITNLSRNTSKSTKIAFYSWSNGNRNSSIRLQVNSPIDLHAVFVNQSAVHLEGFDGQGDPVMVNTFYLQQQPIGNSTFIFDGQGYTIGGAYYKNTKLDVNQSINVNAPANITVYLPIYDVQIKTADVFGIPVNVPVTMTFANGSVQYADSGTYGLVNLYDVPYGFADISAKYGGEVLSAQADNGGIVRITVVSTFDLTVLGIVAIIGFVMYFIASRHLSRPAATSTKEKIAR